VVLCVQVWCANGGVCLAPPVVRRSPAPVQQTQASLHAASQLARDIIHRNNALLVLHVESQPQQEGEGRTVQFSRPVVPQNGVFGG
jgi:hypothetical protein